MLCVIFSGLLQPLVARILPSFLCEFYNVTAQHQQGAFLDAPPPPLPPPPTHKPPPQHQTRIAFVGRYGCALQTMSAPPPPHPQPEPLTRLTAFVLGIKYEADECVCGANYDIALRCQNILRTTFLHAGP